MESDFSKSQEDKDWRKPDACDKAKRDAYGFVFTWNNYHLVLNWVDILKLISNHKDFKWLIGGKELAPTTGTPHLQGAVWFKRCMSWNVVRKMLTGANVVAANGTPEENRNYCIKDKDFIEYGSMPNQGERTDLNIIKDRIMNGERTDDIAIAQPVVYHMYGRTLSKLEDLAMRKKFRTEMTLCDWFCGPTGSGKSHAVFQNYNPSTHYVLNLNDNGWWDGYCQQEFVIINEFRCQIPYGELLDLIDKWPKTVKRRNREAMPFLSKKILITSPMHPKDAYHGMAAKDAIAQLLRRVRVIELSDESKSDKSTQKEIIASE